MNKCEKCGSKNIKSSTVRSCRKIEYRLFTCKKCRYYTKKRRVVKS